MNLRRLIRFVCLFILVTGSGFVAALLPTQEASAADFSCAAVSEIPAVECDGLVALYLNTDGANWLDRTNWLATNTPCNWVGVICDEGHVLELYLPANNLRGSLPSQLANLSQLAFFDVSANDIQGTLPTSLGSLANLEELYVHANAALAGGVPADFMALPTLDLLWYNDTGMCGVDELVRASADADQEEFVLAAAVSAFQAWLINLDDLQSSNVSCPAEALIYKFFLPSIQR